MRNTGLMLLTCLFCLAGAVTQARALPDLALYKVFGLPGETVRMSWEEGIAEGGGEAYQGFRYQGPVGDLGAGELIIRPVSEGLEIRMQDLVMRPSAGPVVSIGAARAMMTLSAGQVLALRDGFPVDLCALWAGNSGLRGEDLRAVFRPESGWSFLGAGVRSLTVRRLNLDLAEGDLVSADTCFPRLHAAAEHVEMLTTTKAGFTAVRMDAAMGGPGSIRSIIDPAGHMFNLSASVSAFSAFINSGLQALTATEATLEAEVDTSSTASLVATLVNASRTGSDIPRERLWEDLWRLAARASFRTDQMVLKVQNVLPTEYTLGVEKAQLRNLLGLYDVDVESRDGSADISISTRLTGLSDTRADIRLSKMDRPDARGAMIRLDSIRVLHKDLGFMKAFEMITSNPMSVFFILMNDRIMAMFPEQAHPEVEKIMAGINRFFSDGVEGTAMFEAVGPRDLTLFEIHELLSRRPELVGVAFPARLGTIRQSPE